MRSRRRFLVDCSIFAAATLLPKTGLGLALPFNNVRSLDLNLATFVGQLHTPFRIRRAAGGVVELELTKAQAVRLRTSNCQRVGGEVFSLIFHGPPEHQLAQRMYTFDHERIGRFKMFIVPVVSRNPQRRSYEAIFDGRIPSSEGTVPSSPTRSEFKSCHISLARRVSKDCGPDCRSQSKQT